ncbi:MAG TPA: S-methyl-5-thioribose-1-phosphate isomerase [Candidatus Eisenbacteria bacterium]|nr:S-methyl-5-thioribose-1-phosphate isomerase [Candidatus Eisenbacteria bacterium]
MSFAPFRLEGDRLLLLDQTLLPEREVWIEVRDATAMADAIARLAVRGAPAIGIAAALALAIEAAREGEVPQRHARVEEAARALRSCRPTAVNLAWAVDRMLRVARAGAAGGPGAKASGPGDPNAWAASIRAEAEAIWREDLEASRAMAAHGASLFPDQRRFLTHCNTGSLATGGGGTALGVLLALHRTRSGGIEVWATETRPLLQGARLTAWELRREGIPATLIPDSAAAHTILHGGIQGVLVGADRIARNGDAANKIGTLGLALAAREAGIPFVVVAPSTTLDASLADGSGIVIEERDPGEVTSIGAVRTAPEGFPARNPAFDVTPGRLITAIVTERGAARGPGYDLGSAFDTEPGPC